MNAIKKNGNRSRHIRLKLWVQGKNCLFRIDLQDNRTGEYLDQAVWSDSVAEKEYLVVDHGAWPARRNYNAGKSQLDGLLLRMADGIISVLVMTEQTE